MSAREGTGLVRIVTSVVEDPMSLIEQSRAFLLGGVSKYRQ